MVLTRRPRVAKPDLKVQKAKTAVLHDKAQRLHEAIESYDESCKFLKQSMMHHYTQEERRELSAIVSF
jgi:hypothetical protein